MIHIRTDHNVKNSERVFACGLGPELPEGDLYFFEGESAVDHRVDCQACRDALGLGEKRQLGTPISQVDGREFLRIAQSWGYP